MEREIQLAGAAGIDVDDTGEHPEDVVIDVDFSWLNSMKDKLASTCAKSSPSFTICRVPAHIRDTDPAAYSPHIISIGPFHRQSTNLQAMEEHKWRYLHKVIKPENDLEKYLKEMKAKEAQARNCYSENITIGSNEFVEMMVLDGCFVLQLIHEKNINGAENKDPIYCNEWMFGRIFNDMLLLENQLPFFILECLWELIGQPRATLRKEAFAFLQGAFPCEPKLKCPEEPDIHHLLHAVHLSLRPAQAQLAREPQSMSTATGKLSSLQLCKVMGKILPFLRRLVETRDTSTPTGQQSLPEYDPLSTVKRVIPSAMELQEAGFRLQRKQARSFFDVTFEKGMMKMPRLWIDDDTNALFRNFIAFEQCFPEWGNHFTSYCMLIDALVNTPRDVSILIQSKIIQHLLGSNEDVALLFNKLCKDITWDFKSSYLANMYEEVNQHTQERWPKWRAKLVRDYFSNPWAIISLIAAIIILIVTLVQTFFAVFSYFRPPKL